MPKTFRITAEFIAEDYTAAYTEFTNLVRASSANCNWNMEDISLKKWWNYNEEREESEHLARKDTVWTRLARRIVRAGSS